MYITMITMKKEKRQSNTYSVWDALVYMDQVAYKQIFF